MRFTETDLAGAWARGTVDELAKEGKLIRCRHEGFGRVWILERKEYLE